MRKKLSIHAVIAPIYLSLALLTLMPSDGASKACRLGYKALCSFSPYGTLILMVVASLHLWLHWRASTRRSAIGSPSS